MEPCPSSQSRKWSIERLTFCYGFDIATIDEHFAVLCTQSFEQLEPTFQTQFPNSILS